MELNNNFFKNKRILNVGCGNDTFGTDFVDLYAMRKEVKVCALDTDVFPYKDNSFDVIYSRCNFEHLRNVVHFLEESKRILKKKGYVLVVTDNANYLGFAFSNGHHKQYKGYGDFDLHYGLYTPEHLETHFSQMGFKVIEFGYISRDILNYRNKIKGSIFVRLFDGLGKIPNKYLKRLFNKRVYIIAQKV